MDYYLSQRGTPEDFYGRPVPEAGARVKFAFDKLMAARAQAGNSDRTETREDGLVLHTDPMHELQLPDRLWRVDDLEGAVQVYPAANWLRAKAVTVREELPAWLVMGPNGDLVAKVIRQARSLTDDQARAIATRAPADDLIRAVEAMWERWTDSHRMGSPIGCGLREVQRAIESAARRTGNHLFQWDEVDEVEVLRDRAWIAAAGAANHAALGLGAPEWFDAHVGEQLIRPWAAVTGGPLAGH